MIQPCVAIPYHGDRAIVHIQQDSIVSFRRAACDNLEYILDKDLHAKVIKQLAVYLAEKFTIPGYDLRKQFGDVNDSLLADKLQHTPQRKAESKTAYKDAWRRASAYLLAGQLRQYLLRLPSTGAHERLVIQPQIKLPAALM